MDAPEIGKLASAWMAEVRDFRKNRGTDGSGWATERMWELENEDPEEMWRTILVIHRLNSNQEAVIVQNLSAGPLEMLLTKHGSQFIERIEEEARKDPSFSTLLGGVDQNRMSEEIWSRVKAAGDISQWGRGQKL
jgi:hypothetical protein